MKPRTSNIGLILALLGLLVVGLFVLVQHFAAEAHVARRGAVVASDPTALDDDSDETATTLAGPELLSVAMPSDPTRRAASHDGDGDSTTIGMTDCLVEVAVTEENAADSRPRGEISGTLLREGGPWTRDALPLEGTVMLDLVSTARGRDNWRGEIRAREGPEGALELSFVFTDIPEGEYELTLSSIGSRRWSPTALSVRSPMSGIVFTRYDKDAVLPLAFEVFDAMDGSAITDYSARLIQITTSRDNGIFLHTGPLLAEAFPIDARFSWSLRAEGYATAFGYETAFETQDDKRVLRIGLERGWSTQVLVLKRDPTAHPARGAEILVDGRSAGFSDAQGLCVVRQKDPPERMEVKLQGWKAAHDPLASFGRFSTDQRAGVAVVMLDRD